MLVGGGHAHVHVMADFGKRPEAGLAVTLVTKDVHTPYSGMLPGLVAGHYGHDEAHIDLVRLAATTGVRLIHATACGLDRAAGRLLLEGLPSVAYDLVSLDIGIAPAMDRIAGAAEHGIAVKPIGAFLEKFEALRRRVQTAHAPLRMLVVGGGAGGVELVLSLRARLKNDLRATGGNEHALSFAIATDGNLLETHNACVRAKFRRILRDAGIALREDSAVVAVDAGSVRYADGGIEPADAVLVATDAAAPAWLRETGLALDAAGFVAVGPTLQALNDGNVFAAGDCAALVETPRPKSGVYAVRAGPPLARNLRAVARGTEPAPWFPQKRQLALISTGAHHAVASRGPFCAEGRWAWRLKDWIDRRWIAAYQVGAVSAPSGSS